MEKFKLIGGGVILCLALMLMFQPTVYAKEPIKIGAIVELTGDAAEMGVENQYTIEVAESLLNARGGIEGYPVKVVMVDGGSDPAMFATKAHRLLGKEQVIAGIGGNDISYATAAGEVFAKAKAPYADIGGTTPTIPLISDFMFMAPGPDNDQGRAVAKYVVENLG
jgi:branched-chain amino acid transport system substrate-binding protein